MKFPDINKPNVNLLIDSCAALAFLGMLTTGYIIRFPLPPGTNKDLTLWGLSRHEWGTIHFWTSITLITILLFHLFLHWQWIVSMVQKRLNLGDASVGTHRTSGLVTIFVFVASFLAFALSAHYSVEPRENSRRGGCETEIEEGNGLPGRTIQNRGNPLEYWHDIYPFLKPGCGRCHSGPTPEAEFNIENRQDFFGRTGVRPRILPGASASSPIVLLLSRGTSSRRFHNLSEENLRTLVRWIDEGARWDDR